MRVSNMYLPTCMPDELRASALCCRVKRQIDVVRESGRAYARALHLAPSNGGHWGDAAAALHLEAQLRRMHPRVTAPKQAPRLRVLAQRLLRGGALLHHCAKLQGAPCELSQRPVVSLRAAMASISNGPIAAEGILAHHHETSIGGTASKCCAFI